MTVANLTNQQAASMLLTNEKQSLQDYLAVEQPVSPKIENPQAHPKHYNHGKYEVIDVIEDWKLGFNLGNVVKYVARADHKGTPTPDLYKALFYLNREISYREKGTNGL